MLHSLQFAYARAFVFVMAVIITTGMELLLLNKAITIQIECLVQVAIINFKVVNLGLANQAFKANNKFSKTKIKAMASTGDMRVKIKSL